MTIELDSFKNDIQFKINHIDKTITYSRKPRFESSSSDQNSELWGKVFDFYYKDIPTTREACKNTIVWKSSYTDDELSQEEMQEWIQSTVNKVKHFKKNPDILEIGCGNGLIFDSLIDSSNSYTGIDNAKRSLELIASSSQYQDHKNKINLFPVEAIDILNITHQKKYDLVIINSVIQYFPNTEYLFSFLEKIHSLLKEDSLIFIGDIRSYRHRIDFYEDIAHYKKSDHPEEEVNLLTLLLKNKEKETLYDHQLFLDIPLYLSYIQDSCIDLKYSSFPNEMNKFRFDAFLYTKKLPQKKLITIESFKGLNEIKNIIMTLKKEELLEIKNIPNSLFFKKTCSSEISKLKKNTKERHTYSPYEFKDLANNEQLFTMTNYASNPYYFNVYLSKEKFNNIPHFSSPIETFSNHVMSNPSKLENNFLTTCKELELTPTKLPYYQFRVLS